MEDESKALRGNIWKMCILHMVRGSLIHVGVLVLFLTSNRLSLREIFILEALWSVMQVSLEIPSGYLSDRWGRKPTLVLGTLAKFIGILIYCLSYHFWGFLLAMLFLSTGSSLFSGTDSAMTFDTLLELKEERRYRYVSGRQEFYRFCMEALSSIAGGLIALISLRATLWASLCFFAIGPIVAMTLVEPKRHKLQETRHLDAMLNIFQTSVVRNPTIRSILILNSILITMAFALFWFTQPYQEMVQLPLALFGITHAIIVLSHAFASRYVHALERWFDDRLLLIAISACTVISYVILGLVSSLWAIVFFFIVRMMWGLTSPLTSDIINRLTTSDIRATVLSFRALGFRLLFAIVAPFLGAAADIYTLNQALLLAGTIGGIAILITFLSMRSVWKQIPR